LNEAATKVCTSCRKELLRTAFHRDRERKDGLEPRCRACRSLAKAKRLGRLAAPKHRSAWLAQAVPTLAADLARQLNPTCSDEPSGNEVVTAEQWRKMEALIESGVPTKIATKRLAFWPWLLRQYLRNPELRVRWNIAKQIWRRRRWPPEVVDEILTDIASTGRSTKDAVLRRGLSYHGWIALTIRDKEIEARYLRAKEVAWFRQADEIGRAAIAMGDAGNKEAGRFGNRAWHALSNTEPRMRKKRMAVAREARGQAANAIVDARRRVAKLRKQPVILSG
jgi:hypothetical protein